MDGSLEGWFVKCPRRVGFSRRRYFTTSRRSQEIAYFTSDEQVTCKGRIYIRDIHEVVRAGRKLRLVTPVREYKLESEDDTTAAQWERFLLRRGASRGAYDNEIVSLYHQTSPEAAAAIVQSQTMRPGATGLAGAGIYFATNPTDTNHKAHQRGAVLCARVRLGRCKTIRPNGDGTLSLQTLQQQGFDSVMIPRNGGTEYVVYDPNQVVSVSFQSGALDEASITGRQWVTGGSLLSSAKHVALTVVKGSARLIASVGAAGIAAVGGTIAVAGAAIAATGRLLHTVSAAVLSALSEMDLDDAEGAEAILGILVKIIGATVALAGFVGGGVADVGGAVTAAGGATLAAVMAAVAAELAGLDGFSDLDDTLEGIGEAWESWCESAIED
eukprot:m.154098 g.154098  ORF g.154098 m.154098 type:complete len:385 (+) comp14363_c0_seq6:135-1289(+)